MVPIGDQFIFGYNVFVGLRTETTLEDVFAVYRWEKDSFSPGALDLMQNEQFLTDFKNLYRYYKRIVAHLMNLLSAVVMPLDRLDYYDEAPEDRE